MAKKPTYRELQQQLELIEKESACRKQVIQESETRYRTFVENFHGIVYQGQLGARPAFFHGDVETITGYSEQAFLSGQPDWFQVIHADDVAQVQDTMSQLSTCDSGKVELEYRIVRKDSQIRWVHEFVRLICDQAPQPPHLQGVVYDITDQKVLESQYQQSRKMEAIAALAGGIAHEYNNALSGITGNIDLLKLYYADDDRFIKYVEPMHSAARRMERLTHQLLAYALGGKYEPRFMCVNELVKKNLPLSIQAIEPAVRVITSLDDKIPQIKADPTQIQMVLSAIISNAVEAVEGSGLIELSTSMTAVEDKLAQPHRRLTSAVHYVCLSVQDNGKGMDNETKARIFEPFFSTKLMGRGLGMAAAYGIVKNHDGWIEVVSEPDQGTEIKIYLPTCEGGPKAHEIRQLSFPWA